MPRIEDILDTSGQAKFISSLDLSKGYYQVLVAMQDKDKTAYMTKSSKY